jgi:putative DNA primase/helicase
VDGDAIPLELRELEQWVLYRLQARKGKATKVPYQVAHAGRRASTTDPDTWATFDAAIEAHERRGRGDGIGFVFTAGDPYVGIDLDACRDPITGEVHPAAARVVLRLAGGYVEVSPSGTGLHVIGRGTVGGGQRTSRTPWGGEFEMYDRGRYFAMTGEVCQIGRATVNVG